MTLRRYAAVNHAFIALASSRFSTVSIEFWERLVAVRKRPRRFQSGEGLSCRLREGSSFATAFSFV